MRAAARLRRDPSPKNHFALFADAHSLRAFSTLPAPLRGFAAASETHVARRSFSEGGPQGEGWSRKLFLYPPDKREHMQRAIRATIHRAQLTYQEVQTLRGMIVALSKGKHRVKKD